MKRILSFLAAISLIFTFSACKKSNDADYTVPPTEQNFTVEINVEIVRNSFFSRYDVDLYIDSTRLGEVEFGSLYTNEISLTQGKHTLRAVKKGNIAVDGGIDFNVEGNMELNYDLYLSKDQIEFDGEANIAEESLIEIHPDDSEGANKPVEENTPAEQENTELTTADDEELLKQGVLTINNSKFLSSLVNLNPKDDKDYLQSLVNANSGKVIELEFIVSSIKASDKDSSKSDYLLFSVIEDTVVYDGPVFYIKNSSKEALNITADSKDSPLYEGKFLRMRASILDYENDHIVLEPIQTVL